MTNSLIDLGLYPDLDKSKKKLIKRAKDAESDSVASRVSKTHKKMSYIEDGLNASNFLSMPIPFE